MSATPLGDDVTFVYIVADIWPENTICTLFTNWWLIPSFYLYLPHIPTSRQKQINLAKKISMSLRRSIWNLYYFHQVVIKQDVHIFFLKWKQTQVYVVCYTFLYQSIRNCVDVIQRSTRSTYHTHTIWDIFVQIDWKESEKTLLFFFKRDAAMNKAYSM